MDIEAHPRHSRRAPPRFYISPLSSKCGCKSNPRHSATCARSHFSDAMPRAFCVVLCQHATRCLAIHSEHYDNPLSRIVFVKSCCTRNVVTDLELLGGNCFHGSSMWQQNKSLKLIHMCSKGILFQLLSWWQQLLRPCWVSGSRLFLQIQLWKLARISK